MADPRTPDAMFGDVALQVETARTRRPGGEDGPGLFLSFRRPFPEQLAAWRLRLAELIPTARWDDIAGPAHDRGFMVAGAVKADLLADLAAAVDKAVAQGTTYEQFRRDFRAVVERHGWHGWTGEGTKAGEEWRMRTIYRTNLRTTYMAGRHAQLVRGNFRFWVYRHSGARHPRLDHLSWDGLALPPDHPFWAVAFPPNGWGCGCEVYGAHSAAGVRRLGGDPDKVLPAGWDRPDPRTGLPRGIQRGWDHAPGATVTRTVAALTERAVHWDYNLATAYMRDLPGPARDQFATAFRALPSLAEELRRWVERAAGLRRGAAIPGPAILEPQKTLGLATEADVTRIRSLVQIDPRFPLIDYALDIDAVRHILNRHGDPAAEAARGQRAIEPADFARLAQLLNDPDSVVAADGDGPPRLRYTRRFGAEVLVALFEFRRGRGRMNLVTMWVQRDVGASPTLTP